MKTEQSDSESVTTVQYIRVCTRYALQQQAGQSGRHLIAAGVRGVFHTVPNNKLNLHTKTEPVKAGADAKVYC